jgi:hypothetical protein
MEINLNLAITLASGPTLDMSVNNDGTMNIIITNPADPLVVTKQEIATLADHLLKIRAIAGNIVSS